MKFNNKESAHQYIAQRKQALIDEINLERAAYEQQYQKIRSIPEVRALVNEVIRLLSEQKYLHVIIGSTNIQLIDKITNVRAQATIEYSAFHLNDPKGNRLAFQKYLCEEIYARLGCDLQLSLIASICGSREVIQNKFHFCAHDCELNTAHNCKAVSKEIWVSGRNVFNEISNLRNQYCMVDCYECDNGNNQYNLIANNNPNIASVVPGFFNNGHFYELTYIENIHQSISYGGRFVLFNSTPNRNSKPAGGVDW